MDTMLGTSIITELGDKNVCEVSFREELAADVFKSLLEETGEFAEVDRIAARAVEGADALIAALMVKPDAETHGDETRV